MNAKTGIRRLLRTTRLLWIICCLLMMVATVFPDSVRAGWNIPVELRDLRGKKPHLYPLQILVGEQSLKVDITVLVGGGGKTDLLFRVPTEEILYVIHEQGVYVVTDEPALAGFSQGVGQLTRFLDQRLGTAFSQPSSDGYRVLPMDKTRKIGDRICTGRGIFRGDRKVLEIWGIPWKQSGVRPSDLAPLQRFLSTAGRTRSSLGQILPLGGWTEPPVEFLLNLETYPVLAQQVVDGSVRMEAAWGKPGPASIGPDDFQVPTHYARKELIPFLIESGYIR